MRPIFLRRDESANAAWLFLLVALGLCAIASGSFYLGMVWKDALYAEAARIEAQKPKRASPATFKPLLSCSKHDAIEYARICRARERMTAVGAP